MSDDDDDKIDLGVWIQAIGGIVIFAWLIHRMWFPGLFASTGDLYMCDAEIHQVSKCSYDGKFLDQMEMDCLFKNNAQVQADPNGLAVWNYDKDDILMETTRVVSSVTVEAGGSVHIAVRTVKDADKSIVCSMDPNSELIKAAGVRKIK